MADEMFLSSLSLNVNALAEIVRQEADVLAITFRQTSRPLMTRVHPQENLSTPGLELLTNWIPKGIRIPLEISYTSHSPPPYGEQASEFSLQ